MRLAERSLPKKNPAYYGGEENSGGPLFCPLEEGVERAQPRFGGKTLFVSEAETMSAFAPFTRSLRAISVVFDGDALPLFSMPDGVGSVFAAGGEKTLEAARFFAGVRRVPCVLFPTNADLRGAYEREGEVSLCKEKKRVALAEGEICCDLRLLHSSLPEAVCSLSLARLSLVEEHALRVFTCAEKSPFYERIFAITDSFVRADDEIVSRNCALRRSIARGAPVGEGEILVNLHKAAGENFPVWRAYNELFALYSAFFECGMPRRFTPDYAARAARAGTKYCETVIPSPEEIALRAELFERMREGFCFEVGTLAQKRNEIADFMKTFAGFELPALDLNRLGVLPEYAPNGLCAYIRDFGLMEF